MRVNSSRREHLKYDGQSYDHVPAKPESKLLRRLMSKTGMNEEEIRSIKKYRKMLSDTQKEQVCSRCATIKRKISLFKQHYRRVSKKLGLPIHSKELCQKAYDELYRDTWSCWEPKIGVPRNTYPVIQLREQLNSCCGKAYSNETK